MKERTLEERLNLEVEDTKWLSGLWAIHTNGERLESLNTQHVGYQKAHKELVDKGFWIVTYAENGEALGIGI